MIQPSKSLWSRNISFVTRAIRGVNVFNSLEKVIACNATDVIFLPYFGIISPVEFFLRSSAEQKTFRDDRFTVLCSLSFRGRGRVLPYMGYIGTCGPKGYGFSAVLVKNRVSILADFGHFGHK